MTCELHRLQSDVQQLCDSLIAKTYEGHADAVAAHITEARRLLVQPDGTLGTWEGDELAYAAAALRVNFLRLALVSVNKAIVVSRLPKDEYDFGLLCGRKA